MHSAASSTPTDLLTHLVTPSLTRWLAHSLTYLSLTYPLARSLTHFSPTPSLPPSHLHSLTNPVSESVRQSVSRSISQLVSQPLPRSHHLSPQASRQPCSSDHKPGSHRVCVWHYLGHSAFFLVHLPAARRPGTNGQVAYWLTQQREGGQTGPEVAQQACNYAAKGGNMEQCANLRACTAAFHHLLELPF